MNSGNNQHHPGGMELQSWLDGELSGEQRREVAGHLEACTGCREELRSLQALFGELESLEQTAVPEPGQQFSRRVMVEIIRHETAERVRRNRVMVPAAAAAVLALVLAFSLMPSPGLPSGAGSEGGMALPVLLGALLKVVHSGVVLAAEGLDLVSRLTRTVSALLTALPVSVWAACLTLFFAVHGALAICLQQYARRNFARL